MPRHLREPYMLGWMIIFALLFMLGLTFTLLGSSLFAPTLATATSGGLLLACVLSRLARGRI